MAAYRTNPAVVEGDDRNRTGALARSSSGRKIAAFAGAFGGTTRYASYTTEFILFCRRGSLAPKRRWDSTWFEFKRPYNHNGAPAHSAKPEGLLDVVEQVSPGPYAELFARRARFGWDYPIGDQALGGVAA